MQRTILSVIALTTLILSACSSPSSSSTPPPKRACSDVVDAMAKADQRCGGDYKKSYDSYMKDLNNCADVVEIRDESSLRKTCIPWFGSVECGTQNIDPSCEGQLLRKQAVEPTLVEENE